MTDIYVRLVAQGLAQEQVTSATMTWTPTTATVIPTGVLLPAPKVIAYEGAAVTLTGVEPCAATDGWGWRVTVTVDGAVVWSVVVLVPDSNTVISFRDLHVVDPDSLTPGANVAAWQAALDQMQGILAAVPADYLTAEKVNDVLGRIPDLTKIVCIGDSITQGNQDGSGVTYPSLLNAAVFGSAVYNQGISGWTSTEIAVRYGMPVRLDAFTVPAGAGAGNQATVTVNWPSASWRTDAELFPSWLGELRIPGGAVIPGRLRHQIDSGATPRNKWTFERTTAGSSLSAPNGTQFVATEYSSYTDGTLVINVGRNNTSDPAVVIRDIEAILAARATPGRALVLPVQTKSSELSGQAGWLEVKRLNDALRAHFPQHFVDDLRYMVDKGLALNGLTPTTADLWAAEVDDTVPPQLLVADGIHPNQYGYRAKTAAVIDGLSRVAGLIAAPNWVSGTDPSRIGGLRWRADDLLAPVGRPITGWKDRRRGVNMSVNGGVTCGYSDNRKCVRLDGTSGYLSVPIGRSQPVSILVFGRFRSMPATSGGIAWSAGSPGCYFACGSTGGLTINGGSSVSTGAGKVTANTSLVMAAVFNGASSLVGVSGDTATGSVGSLTFSTAIRFGYAYFGGALYSALDIYEIRVIPGALDDSQINSIAWTMTVPSD